MSRRRTNIFDVAEAFSKFPPFITAPLGIVGYFVPHYFATKPFASPVAAVVPGHTASREAASKVAMNAMNDSFLHLFGMVFQYIIPFVMAVSVILWLLKYQERRRIKAMANNAITPEAMTELSWSDFELVVAQGFTSFGFHAQMTKEGADGGVDIILTKGDQRFLVQCKHWKSNQVGVDVVRSMYGVMHADAANGVYIITSGTFSPDATKFAEGKPIWLYNGEKLRTLLRAGKEAASAGGKLTLDRTTLTHIGQPRCPNCRSEMTIRTARSGPHNGSRFFGCSTFPKCDGILPID